MNPKERIFAHSEKRKLAIDMLERYTGINSSELQPQIILTNFDYYIREFCNLGNCKLHSGSIMESATWKEKHISMINFNIGSPTAALIIEILASISPKAVLFLGMCGGLHPKINVGEFVLPMAAIRNEGTSLHFMPPQVPALPTFKIQKFVSQILAERNIPYKTGVVHSTDYRFWEFNKTFKKNLVIERALGIEMECSTLFITGFASKVPIGALLLVSDIPLRKGGIKTKASANHVFKKYTKLHLELGIQSMTDIQKRGESIRHFEW